MTVPTFKRFWGPTLQALSDGETRAIDDVVDLVAWHFNLSDTDRFAMTRGGTNTQMRDRINWATTYLAKAGLLSRPSGNQVQITDRGKSVLRDLDRGRTLDLDLLRQFPEFVEFERRRGTRRSAGERPVGNIAESIPEWNSNVVADRRPYPGAPRRRLQGLMQQFVSGLEALELLFVAQSLLVSAGYHLCDAESVAAADGNASDATCVMSLDAFRVARVLVQAIQSDGPVPSALIHRHMREMSVRRCRFGVLIARHEFAPDARETPTLLEKDIVLIDGDDLARRLTDGTLGVAVDSRRGPDA